jgi:hypothetical protein
MSEAEMSKARSPVTCEPYRTRKMPASWLSEAEVVIVCTSRCE